MANHNDQFFTEEDAPSPAAAPGRPAASKSAPREKGGIKPPTFGMAVAIAAVALILGLCLGYMGGMYVASNSSVASPSAQVATTTVTASSAAQGGELPSSHPDLSQFLNADGTVNEEALAEYKAQHPGEGTVEKSE